MLEEKLNKFQAERKKLEQALAETREEEQGKRLMLEEEKRKLEIEETRKEREVRLLRVQSQVRPRLAKKCRGPGGEERVQGVRDARPVWVYECVDADVPKRRGRLPSRAFPQSIEPQVCCATYPQAHQTTTASTSIHKGSKYCLRVNC